MTRGSIAVALSGGVDSAAAAISLLKGGQSPVGLYLRLHDAGDGAERAFSVANRLGIPLTVVDARERFGTDIIRPFVQSYSLGLTPNPCVLCNRLIKFGMLLDAAVASGFGALATGHYARSVWDRESDRWLLLRGVDPAKDQSYVLHALTQHALGHAVFPLGDRTKAQARRLAEAAGVLGILGPESQDVCFVDRDYWRLLESDPDFEPRAGPIVDAVTGAVLGRHRGIHRYTVGQRRGLGIASPQPRYVIAIDEERSTVLVGDRDLAMVGQVDVMDATFIPWVEPPSRFRATARHRYRSVESAAEIRVLGCTPVGWRLCVEFDEPQFAPAPGQSLVMYCGEVVLGGGVIMPRAHRPPASPAY